MVDLLAATADDETAPGAEAVPDVPVDVTAPATRRWLDWAVPTALVAATVATRLPRLTTPSSFVFDEVYYAPDAADLLRRGVERGGVVHPQGGKWLIAGGIRLFGFTPFGWRFAALVCGALVVLLTYLAARQVVTGHVMPALAGGLVAVDGISFTTGRIAMLDVFVTLFVAASMVCTLAALREPLDPRRIRRCRWGAAIALGLGLTVKWSVAYVLLASLLLLLVATARASSPGEPRGRRLLATAATLLLVPPAIYAVSYAPWLANSDKAWISLVDGASERELETSALATVRDEVCDRLPERLDLWCSDQIRIADFQLHLESFGNSNAAPTYQWATLDHPSVLFRKRCVPELAEAPEEISDDACDGAQPGDTVEIVAAANPIVWFSGLLTIPVLLWRAARRRDLATLALLIFVAHQWVPWLLDERHTYSFYQSTLIPVLAVMTVSVLSGRRWWLARPVIPALALVAFVFYYPIWSGMPLDRDGIKARHYWEAL